MSRCFQCRRCRRWFGSQAECVSHYTAQTKPCTPYWLDVVRADAGKVGK